jgi:TRAP-type C4-dicarboxylate transport system permease small subunit
LPEEGAEFTLSTVGLAPSINFRDHKRIGVNMEGIQRFKRILLIILQGIITFFFSIILILTILLVVLRYGFNTAIIGGNEAMEYLFIYTTAIGAAVALGKREHIKITYFVDSLPLAVKRVVNVLDLILIGFINGVMIWYSIPWIKSVGSFESPVLRIPNRIVQASVPIGCSLVILCCLCLLVTDIFEKKQGEFSE